MNAPNSKPLDLAQFADDALHTPMGAPLDPQQVAPALLAECKRQREQIAALKAEPIHALRTDIERLRETLSHIASGLSEPHLEGGLTKAEAIQIARAALEATK